MYQTLRKIVQFYLEKKICFPPIVFITMKNIYLLSKSFHEHRIPGWSYSQIMNGQKLKLKCYYHYDDFQ